MLMNNLDPEVAERPQDLVVYGGTGKAARDWPSYHALVRTLTTLGPDETMLVQSGRPVGVFRTHEWAPRVLLANSNLVGDWATWPEFRRLEALGLTMYGQMTAGSWIYIGTQGILQGTYETFAAVAAKRVRRRRSGRHADADRRLRRHGRRAAARGHHERRRLPGHRRRPGPAAAAGRDPLPRRGRRPLWTTRSSQAVRGQARPAGAVGRRGRQRRDARPGAAAPRRADRHRHRPDLAPTTRCPTCPRASTSADAPDYAAKKPEEFTDRARASMAKHVEAMVGFLDAGAEVFDYGNSIRGEAQLGGYERAFAFPGFVPAYIRPLFCEGKGPFRWAALSGDPADIAATDRAVLDLFPENESLARWIRLAGERVAFQGLPARICWLGYGERDMAGAAVQRDGRRAASCRAPDRDRPRPPRLRLGRLAVPGDRGDARRLRRDRRLAAAQRAGQHGQRRLLGVHPPRRRRRHRPLHPRRPGQRRRRHARWPRRRSNGCSPTTRAWA